MKFIKVNLVRYQVKQDRDQSTLNVLSQTLKMFAWFKNITFVIF